MVGAGAAGLAAAYRALRLGRRVAVYEAAERAGGVVRTERRAGYLAEWGPNSLAAPPAGVTALITELGLDADRVEASPAARRRYVVRRGRPVPLPLSPWALLRSPLFSWRGKLRIAREPFVPVAGDPEAEESVADFVRRRFGAEAVDYAAAPLVSGIYAGDPEALSAREALPRLVALERTYGSVIKGASRTASARKAAAREGRAGSRSRDASRAEASGAAVPGAGLFTFREGLQQIPDALARALGPSLRLATPVRAIRRLESGWGVVTDRGTEVHDAVVLAVPAYAIAALPIECRGPGLGALGEIPHPPVAVLVLGFRRNDVAHPLDGFGLLAPPVERRRILGVVFSSSLFPGRAPEGHVTLAAFVGGALGPPVPGDPDLLEAWVLEELAALLGVRGRPTFRHCTVWPRAIPQYVMGYARYREVMDAFERENPGLLLAGGYRRGVSLGDTLECGLEAGERAARAATERPTRAGDRAARETG